MTIGKITLSYFAIIVGMSELAIYLSEYSIQTQKHTYHQNQASRIQKLNMIHNLLEQKLLRFLQTKKKWNLSKKYKDYDSKEKK